MSNVVDLFSSHYRNNRVPLWMRVVYFALENDGRRLGRGELKRAVDPFTRPPELSRAIARAKQLGLLTYDSNARCLHLKGYPPPGRKTPSRTPDQNHPYRPSA